MVERSAKTLEVAHIGLGGDDAPARLLHQVRGVGEVGICSTRIGNTVDVLTDIDRDDVGAFFGEPDGMLTALATRCASDECDLACDSADLVIRHRGLSRGGTGQLPASMAATLAVASGPQKSWRSTPPAAS